MTAPESGAGVHRLPNKIGRIVLLALEEVIGRNGVNAVLNVARLPHLINNAPPNNLDPDFDFADLGACQQALEDLYGPRGGRGLALRTGRASFAHALREFGPMLGLTDLSFRLLPMQMKLKTGLEGFADILNRYSDMAVRIDDDREAYACIVERCPLCWGRHSDSPACHLAVGFFQEAFTWLSSGKNFLVEETSCVARGDPCCAVRILRHPID